MHLIPLYGVWSVVSKMASSKYQLPGEYMYDGVKLHRFFPKEGIEKVKEFVFRSDDILIATYPKSGERCHLTKRKNKAKTGDI